MSVSLPTETKPTGPPVKSSLADKSTFVPQKKSASNAKSPRKQKSDKNTVSLDI
jgi:hypothetical protein